MVCSSAAPPVVLQPISVTRHARHVRCVIGRVSSALTAWMNWIGLELSSHISEAVAIDFEPSVDDKITYWVVFRFVQALNKCPRLNPPPFVLLYLWSHLSRPLLSIFSGGRLSGSGRVPASTLICSVSFLHFTSHSVRPHDRPGQRIGLLSGRACRYAFSGLHHATPGSGWHEHRE